MRVRPVIAGGIATTAAVAALVATGGRASAFSDFTFFADYKAIESIDLGAKGVSIGDRLNYHDRAFTSASRTTKIADGYGDCARLTGRTDTSGRYQCTETVHLKGGDILIGGLYDLSAPDDTWTIAGGTGKYKGARGTVYFKPLTATTLSGAFRFQ